MLQICRENQNTLFMFCSFFPPKSCHFRDSVEEYSRIRLVTDGNIIRRMCFACWIIKASDTHAEYVILIDFTRH